MGTNKDGLRSTTRRKCSKKEETEALPFLGGQKEKNSVDGLLY